MRTPTAARSLLMTLALAAGALGCRADPPPTAAARTPAPVVEAVAPAAAPSPAVARDAVGAPRIPRDEERSVGAGPRNDPLSREKVRGLVERVVEEKLPGRGLAPGDYDRLTDAVMRLRAAARTVRRTDDSAAGAGVRMAQQAAMASALDDIERITGLDSATLGDALTAEDPRTEAPSPN